MATVWMLSIALIIFPNIDFLLKAYWFLIFGFVFEFFLQCKAYVVETVHLKISFTPNTFQMALCSII